jgi:uncharacterized protein YkwD
MSNPTGQEQEYLELVNRMRTAPSAELNLLLKSTDPTTQANIDVALKQFGTNIDTVRSQWASLVSAAPLAWASELNNSAATHNQSMIAANLQAHVVPGGKDFKARITDANYDFNAIGENIFAAAESILYSHAGLAIDWGADDPNTPELEAIDGIQNPAGHRNILLSSAYREVGISITAENDPNTTNVGPLVITQDFGDRAALNGRAYILGVAFEDANNDNLYQNGEGLSTVQVKITNVDSKTTQTLTVGAAGGYQQLVDPGKYQVEFIRDGVIVQTQTTSISQTNPQNVKLDLVSSNKVSDSPVSVTVEQPTAIVEEILPVTIDMVKRTVGGENPDVVIPVMNFINDSKGISETIKNLVIPVINFGAHLQNGEPEHHLLDFSKDFSIATTPDLKAKTITVDFVEVTGEASYHNYAGLYRVDDATGKIGDLNPGDAGYTIAALKRSKEAGKDVEFDRKGTSTKSLEGGYIYAPFVVADGTVDQVLNSKNPATVSNVFFNYVKANADGYNHIKSLGANKFGFEDTFGGGDQDHNDLIFKVDAKIA